MLMDIVPIIREASPAIAVLDILGMEHIAQVSMVTDAPPPKWASISAFSQVFCTNHTQKLPDIHIQAKYTK